MAEKSHYTDVADIYETAWCYKSNGEFQQWLVQHIQALLPEGCNSIADVGCGTGNFSKLLQEQSHVPVTCVEPSSEMAAKAAEHGMHVVVEDALAWGEGVVEPSFGAVLLKEVRHHFTHPADVYGSLAKTLAPQGRLISVTRPDDPVGYPFFEAARQRWREGNSASVDSHKDAMRDAGLEVSSKEETYRVTMSRAEWERLVRGRFWSHFSVFSDQEVEDGIKELGLSDPVEFDDRLIFTVAEKPA